jgi:hypothetical protein
VLEASVSPTSLPQQKAILLALLRDASLTIDGLLHSELSTSDTAAVDLTEASQAIHRELIVAHSSHHRRGKVPSVFSLARDRQDLWMRLLDGTVLPDGNSS